MQPGKERKRTMTDTTQASKARTAMPTGMVALLLSAAPLMLAAAQSEVAGAAAYATSTNEEDAAASKLQQALSPHAAKTPSLLQCALWEVDAEAEVGPDGSIQGECWRAEFALEALENETRKLDEPRGGGEDEEDHVDYYSEDEGDDEEEDYDYVEFGEGGGDGDYDSEDEGNEDEGNYEDAEDYSENREYDEAEEAFSYNDLVRMEQYLRQDKELKALLDAIPDERRRIETYEDIRHEALFKDDLDPDRWDSFSYWGLHAYFSCERVFAGVLPLYDNAKWRMLRDHWNAFRRWDTENRPIPEGEPERMFQFTTGSFEPPLIAFHSGEKGRGLKAARDIAAGELVFKATNNTVIFADGHMWRMFLFSIYERDGEPYDAQTTCDVLQWSWVQPMEDGSLAIVVDLDNGSMLNAGRDKDGYDRPNVRCGQVGDTMCRMSYYAMTDIKEGEELLTDYRGFALADAWRQMEL